MTQNVARATALVLGVLLSFVMGARAQTGNRIDMFGTVDKVEAASFSVSVGDGGTESFHLGQNVLVVRSTPATLADIQPDDFVASAAIRGADGKLHSTELRIFPAAMRGVGEGQRAMNDSRGQTMTNAVVTGTAVMNGSNNIKVRFEGGESELVLDPGVPVTRLVVVDKNLVKVGAKVRVQGLREADGATANRITLQ